jgi:ribosomal protein L40E
MGQIVSVGKDVIEVGRAFAAVERASEEPPPKPAARLEAKDPPTTAKRAFEAEFVVDCTQCGSTNSARSEKCWKCGALMPPRSGAAG